MSEPTWTEIQSSVAIIEKDLCAAETELDYQALGTKCRSTVLDLAHLVFSEEKHVPKDVQAPGSDDSKEMLTLYFMENLKGRSAAKARGFVHGLVNLSNDLVHHSPSRPIDAKLAFLGLLSIVEMVSIFEGSDLSSVPWKGVKVGNRYFAWDGPTLHDLEDRDPIPTPPDVIKAINNSGFHTSSGLLSRIQNHLAQGAYQIYETDKRTWRRQLTYGDRNSVLLVKEE